MWIYIASLVKIPCYLVKLLSRNEKYGRVSGRQLRKIWRNLPISNPKPDLLNVNAYRKLVKIPSYLLKLSSRKENMAVSRADIYI